MASLDELLAEKKRAYEAAKKRGDAAGMRAAHEAANALRAAGASELAANKLVYGADTGTRRTQQYSAGYISGYDPSKAGTRQMSHGGGAGVQTSTSSAGGQGAPGWLNGMMNRLTDIVSQDYQPRVPALHELLRQYGAENMGTPTIALQNALLANYLGQVQEQGRRQGNDIEGLIRAVDTTLPYFSMPLSQAKAFEYNVPLQQLELQLNFLTRVLDAIASLMRARGGGY